MVLESAPTIVPILFGTYTAVCWVREIVTFVFQGHPMVVLLQYVYASISRTLNTKAKIIVYEPEVLGSFAQYDKSSYGLWTTNMALM